MHNRITNSCKNIFVLNFALSVLLAVVSGAHAETLHQWKEADGSLTFSPTPPPEGSGIEYRLMNTGSEPTADISLPETTLTASEITQSQPATPSLLPRSANVAVREAATGSKQVQTETEAQAAKPSVQYAPSRQLALRNAMPEGISRAEPAKNTAKREDVEESNQSEVLASRHKGTQCADLGKRIMALENTITQSKTAEHMDNAILQIARYQRSYNAHCE